MPNALPHAFGGRARAVALAATAVLGLSVLPLVTGATAALAATPLNVFVGYMDTHSVPFSSNQPNPWPYTTPASYDGSPCPNYPNDTTCWDASALRLDNPGATDVTGVHVVVDMGSSVYDLWASNLTIKAHSMLVLTETGGQNSTNFDGSDFAPNAYNGGNTASCVNSGAIPDVKITIAGTTTTYLDSGQILNGGGVDSGHCLNGSFVSGRMDESRQWVQIGSAAPTAPSAPQSLSATAGSGSVTLSWSPPASNGGAAISGYNVYRGTTPGGESATPIAANVAVTGFTDTSVSNGTTYYYTVAAVNSAGVSAASNESFATPTLVQATVPSAPQTLTATGANGSVKLTWTAPASNGGSAITGYNVYRGTTPGGESATPVTAGVTGTSFTDPTVTNGTTYYYTVAAVNAVGPSAPSAEASATPQATVPSAPSGLVASGGSGQVVLSWSAPATDGGSPVTGYNVYRGTTPGGESATPIASAVSLTSFTDTGVSNGTTYYYTVAAVNAVGTSAGSGEASATPKAAATVPSAPQGLTATGGNASVKLTWTAPASNGGAAITGYNVYRGTTPGGESATPVATGVAGTSFTDTGLTNGTTYYYTVTALNAVGTSAPSGEASAPAQATAPTAPLGLTAAAGNTTVSLSWSVPATNGGAAISGYNVYRGTTAGSESATPIATGVTGTSFTDTSLTNGTTYYYTVAAVNAAGTSAQSAEASATPQAAAPVTYVRRVGSATASTAKTTTTIPIVAPGVGAGDTLVVSMLLSSTSTTAAITAKDTAGNTYTLARDTNDGSAGDRSVILVATAVKAIPAGGSITLTYSSAAETHVTVDEFSGITGIDASVGATGTGTAFSSGSTPATSQASELLIGSVGAESGTTPAWTTGWTPLPALNVSGDYLGSAYKIVSSTGSYAATGTSGGQWMAGIVTLKAGAQAPPTTPSAPSGLVASGGSGQVALSWTAPASNGGAAITGYNVYRGTTPGGESATPIATGVAGTSFTNTGLTNGTTYYYTVAAVNAVGPSAQSAEASATPQATATVPSAPQTLTATGGNASVSLSWTAPASNGGAAITGYNVYRGTTPGGESATPITTGVTGTSFTDTGATNGTTYYYTVAAVNAVGTSAHSGEASATPQAVATVPSAPQGLTAAGGNASVSLSWTAPASNGGAAITGYNVYRGTTPGGESATPITTGLTGTSFTDTGVTNGTTYYYTVAAVNAVGTSAHSGEASATPQAPGTAAYVRRVGSATASTAKTTIAIGVTAPGVAAGHTLVISMLLSSTSTTAAITAKDTAGNTYTLARDTNDGSAGDRSVILVATAVKAIGAGGSITLTYPSAAETHVAVDEFSGITGIDASAGATGTAAAFSSGSTAATSQASELLIGTLGTESGTAPAWATGWTALPALNVSTDYLGAAYRFVTTAGSYAASGTTKGQWMAGIVTLKTG